jgi:hypothetical protein
MPSDRPGITGTSLPDRPGIAARPRAVRSAVTNNPAMRHGRTAEGRRVRDLYAGYLAALGGPVDTPTLALILAAAEAVAIAEIARRDCLAGLTGTKAEVSIRLENMANRSLRRIGLAGVAKAPKLTIEQQLAAMPVWVDPYQEPETTVEDPKCEN